jgi:hypothetical protein
MTITRKGYRLLRFVLPPGLSLSIDTWRHLGYWPDLKNPSKFNEKIQYFKLHFRDPQLPGLVDKILVKDHVRNKLGDGWVNPTLWSGKRLPPLAERNWKIPYVIKPNNASGRIFLAREPIRDWGAIEAKCNQWLKTSEDPLLREWAYYQIDPRILVEPYLGPPTETPIDYKFYVYSGRAEYIQVDTDRFASHKRCFFNRDWIPQPFRLLYPMEQREIPKPRHFPEMLRAAEVLGADFAFVRVDLYDVDRPIFGEMTFYPESGYGRFDPPSMDLEFGRLWNISNHLTHWPCSPGPRLSAP